MSMNFLFRSDICIQSKLNLLIELITLLWRITSRTVDLLRVQSGALLQLSFHYLYGVK
jgi:hypothetical protein